MGKQRETVSGFGDKLRREREMRGVSLEEISESTKIGTRSLRALEDEDFEKLPGGIFNKGFVRAYSHFLGLDEDETVADFEIAWKEYQTAHGIPEPELIVVEDEPEPKRSATVWVLVAAIILIVVAVAGYLWKRHQAATQNRPPASAVIDSAETGNRPAKTPKTAARV